MISYDFKSTDILKAIKRVAAYLRKSQGESEEDLERHKGVIIEICEKYNWNYVIYPEIVSGDTIANRPKMLELLDDVQEEMYDAVFVFDYDRLGRGSGADQERIISTLKNADTIVILANPFTILDPNDERDEETMEFKGFLARREYKSIRKRFKAGRAISLKLGHWASGYAPFGYEINKELKKLVVNQEQKQVIRELILEPYLNGKSSLAIAEELNRRNIRTNRGYLWTPKAVFYTLTNKTYLGHNYYNRRDKKGNMKPEGEWSVTLNTHEAIITEEEMEQVLAIKEKRAITGKKTVNALGSLIRCYNCGNTMRIRKDSGVKVVYKCTNCNENKGGLLSLVEDTIRFSLLGIKSRLESGNIAFTKPSREESISNEIARIETEIKKVERAILKIQEAYEADMYTVEVAMERTRLRQNELTEWQKLLKKEKKKLDEIDSPNETITLSNIDQIIHAVENQEDDSELKKIYENIFEAVIWERNKWDEISVGLKFK